MAEKPVVHIGENSPEEVALKLLDRIATVEGVVFSSQPAAGWKKPDRKWILDTYSECFEAVRGHRNSGSGFVE